MTQRASRHTKAVLDPNYDFRERALFLKEHAVELTRDMAQRIRAQKEHIARLESANSNLRRMVEEEREKVPVPAGDVYDWQQVVDAMEGKLRDLRLHLSEHDLCVDSPDMVAEILHCLRLIDKVRDQAGFDDKGWNELWDYVKEHMRGWWD